MRVWTDGSTHLVLGPRGLTRYTKGRAESITLGEAAPSPKGALAWHARGVLAVDVKTQTAWVEWNGKLREVRLGQTPAAPRACDWKPKDMVITADGLAVAVLDAGKGKGRIVAGPVPPDGNWKKTLEVPEPKKVKWPAGVIWAKGVTPPWSKASKPGHDAYLSVNAHGVALAERSSGIVARMPPGKSELDFAVRVPTQDEADVTATATPQGLLIVVCIEGRNSAAIHVDAKGKLLATLAQVRTELEDELAWGFGPPALVGAEKAFLVHEYTIPQVLDLKLPGLEVESTWELPATSEGEKSIVASPDGKACLLGFGGESWLLTRTPSGWQLDELGGAGAPSPGAPAAEDEAADLDIAAMLKAALGGGGGGAAARGASGGAKPGKPAKEKKPAPAVMHPEKALDEFEDEREAHVEKTARPKKKKRGAGDEEPDLGFGDLEEELGEEDEDVEELEEEGLQEREPGDEGDDAGEAEEEEEGAAPKPAAVPPGARRPSIEGEPALTLVAQAGAPKMWGAKPGATLSIDLGFGNVGGASKGIFLEVEGGPIGAKKLVPRSARVGGKSVAFAEPKGNKARIEIRDVALSAGAVNEKAGQPPVPSEVLTVTVELDASQAVDDLLLVRLGPLRVLRPGAGAFTHGKRLLIAP